MKVLILSYGSDTGCSSFSCGKEILWKCQKKGIFCVMEDIRYFSPFGTEKLEQYVGGSGFHSVVCTDVCAVFMIMKAIRRDGNRLPVYFVSTDYACRHSYRYIHPDIWFIPDDTLKKEFVRCGIPRERLVVSGIPIQKEFYETEDKAAAKRKTGISYCTAHLMIICDGVPGWKIKRLLKMISSLLWNNACISVICGTDLKLYEKLKQSYGKDERIKIKRTVLDLSGLMDSVDVLMLRPKAIPAAEGAQKKIPMIFMEAKTFREQSNQRYFIEKRVAVTAKSTKDLAELACRFLYYDNQLAKFAENYRSMPERNAAEMIVKRIMDDCAKPGGD